MTTTIKTPAAAIRAVADAAIAVGRIESRGTSATADAIAAYKAAGTESDEMKVAFMSGYLAGSLCLTGDDRIAKARAILDKKGFGAKARATARRTEKQESAYAGARKALSRVRKAAGVTAADTRGGKRAANTAPKTGKTSATGKEKAAAKTPATMIPAMSTAPEAAAFMLAFSNKNSKTFAGAEGKELQRAIAAFAKAQSDPAH